MSDQILEGAAIEEISKLVTSAQPVQVVSVETPDGITIPVVTHAGIDGATHEIDIHQAATKWLTAPRRRKGTAKALTLDGFIALVNRHKDADSAVFADIISDRPSLIGVIDYNTIDQKPRFGEHRVSYAFPISDEWKAWKENDGKPMAQGDFAAWVEDHIAELGSPYDAERTEFEPLVQTTFGAPNEIVRLARGLQINVDSVIADIRTLQTGEGSIKFEENHQTSHKDSDGKPLKIPGLIMLSIPLFVGGANVRVPARLRYRASGGKITWSYHLYRWKEAFRVALEDDVERVGAETELPVFEGHPEA